MTPTELRAWQKRCGLRTHAEAAKALGIAVSTYRQKRTGRASITKQTELLCAYYEIYGVHWAQVAEATIDLAELTGMPISPAAAAKVMKVLTKVIDLPSNWLP